jgi:hypothetical protein
MVIPHTKREPNQRIQRASPLTRETLCHKNTLGRTENKDENPRLNRGNFLLLLRVSAAWRETIQCVGFLLA